ncbi:CBS domain-containing protein [Martelella soudanensis]|uniref:CBS domain-containing protein n=1 Tax=unclassified Martelella TaxID=2629616 RepID=UPI001FF02488|nr:MULTISPECIES: CBS domain-containing protein [unclassified Martelella]
MSIDLITVGPETRLRQIADLFRRHKLTSLPVVGTNDEFLGVIFQIHLINRARQADLLSQSSLLMVFRRIVGRGRPAISCPPPDHGLHRIPRLQRCFR